MSIDTEMAVISETDRQGILAEYNALRAEILILIQARNQFLIIDLGGFAAAFGWAAASANDRTHNIFFLIAPLIHYPIALYWAYANRQIVTIGQYIKDAIEVRIGSMGWEATMFCKARNNLERVIFTYA
jgi:hypothetical protein